jgi:hypothetical protein
MNPRDLGKFVDKELAAWAKVIRDNKITVQ